jgi:tetratricopeptide (TPR) repeat protein
VLKAVPNGMPVLVTSRQRFGLGKIVDVGDLPLDEALSLLGYHAGEKDYSADEGAHRLCEELGHHPYALEIAGTTLKVDALTPEELCEEIANAPHDMPMPEEFAKEGRQSVKELLDGSFDALDAETQAVFWAFGALFAPGATSALLAVYMKREKRAVREALRKLVRRSLAKRLKGIDYYYVHELTFSYAETMVFGLEVPDRQPTVAAVQRYVIGHAQDFDNLQLDLSNILQAAKAADDQALVPIMSALTVGGYPEMQSPSFFDVRGHTLDLLVCLDKAIEVAGQMRVGQNELRHYLLSKRGNAHFDRGRLEEAFGVYQAALELAPNPNRKVILLAVMGKVRAKQGRYDEANDYFGQGYELAEANQDERALAFVLELQSVAAGGKGDFGAARRFAAQAVEVNRRLEGQDSARLGYSLLNLGSAEGDLGIQKALSIHQKAYEIARDEGDLDLMASVLYALGCDYHALYKYGEAQKHLDEARKLFLQIGCTAEETEVAVFMRQFGYSAM